MGDAARRGDGVVHFRPDDFGDVVKIVERAGVGESKYSVRQKRKTGAEYLVEDDPVGVHGRDVAGERAVVFAREIEGVEDAGLDL